jgi:monofunctional biosynthetic peptidoglycan transglycosylase
MKTGSNGEIFMTETANQTILDFNSESTPAWDAIDDRIMGGLSQSQPEHIDGIGLRFSGSVSLENNGGFASIRSGVADFDLSAYCGLKLRLRGDGKTYKLSLRTDVFYDGVSYQAEFATTGEWQEIELPFESFVPTHHGKKLTTVAPMDAARVRSFGLFIAGRQKGPFQLDIATIKGI